MVHLTGLALETKSGKRTLRKAVNPRPALRAGMIVVALTFLGFGSWASFTPLARGAHAPGKITIDTNRKTVQHLEGGIVKEIHVHEGQTIAAGDVLVTLDPIQSRTKEQILFHRLVALSLQEARLDAELRGADHFQVPAALEAYENDPRIDKVFEDQFSLFLSRREEVQSRISILQEQLAQIQFQIQGMEAQQVANRRQAVLILDELKGVRTLADKGLVSLTRLRSLEREAARLDGEHASRVADIARSKVAIGEVRLQIEQVTEARQKEVIDELNRLRAQLAESSEQLKAAQDSLRRTEVIAPVSGQIVDLRTHTVGGVIRPGEKITDIVPSQDRLVIEAKVKPLDADVVTVGQEAHVVFSGLPKRTSPHLKAFVTSISTDTLTDSDTGLTYYLARVLVSKEEMKILEDIHIVSGMPVEVLIRAGDRTVLSYLVAPWTDLFFKAMREY